MNTLKNCQSHLLQAAFMYADREWRVFPLTFRTKIPRGGSHGHLEAATDGEQILNWWGQEQLWNVAIATGQASNLVMLDIDRRQRGDLTLSELELR